MGNKLEKVSIDIFSAAVLGNKAFNDGKKRIPHHDKDLMDLVNTYTGWGDNSKIRIRLLTEWLSNWDLANLYNN